MDTHLSTFPRRQVRKFTFLMAPPVTTETIVNTPGASGAQLHNDNEEFRQNNESDGQDDHNEYLTPYQKAQATKLKNADRFLALEENVAKISFQINRLIQHSMTNATPPAPVAPAPPPAHVANTAPVFQQPLQITNRADACTYTSRTSTPHRHHSRTSKTSNRANATRHNDFSPVDNFDTDFVIDPRHEREARLQASFLMDSLNPAFPRTEGKSTEFNIAKKSPVSLMPRHLLDLRAQRRNKSLDSPDDIPFPDFVQGFSKLILTNKVENRVVRAMLTHLAQVGEDVATYEWPHIREWSNTVLQDISAQRYSWSDTRIIEAERNRAAIHAGAARAAQSDANTCPLFNRGNCSHNSSHGSLNIHACAFCWLAWGVENHHPINLCKKRLGSQSSHQNRQGGSPSRNRNHNRRGYGGGNYHQHRDTDSKNE